MDKQMPKKSVQETYTIKYLVWVQGSRIDEFECEWDKLVTELSDLGAVGGRVERSHSPPHQAYLFWRDVECWENYNLYCNEPPLADPIAFIASKMGGNAVMGVKQRSEGIESLYGA